MARNQSEKRPELPPGWSWTSSPYYAYSATRKGGAACVRSSNPQYCVAQALRYEQHGEFILDPHNRAPAPVTQLDRVPTF